MEWTLVQLDIAVVSGSPETERAIEHYRREADLVERHSLAHWRRVAKALRPTELDEIDACIAASERSTQIRAWIDGPDAELTEALISDALF